MKTTYNLQSPNDDSGKSNSGGFSFMDADNLEDDDASNTVDSGSSNTDSINDDDYRSYHRIGKSGESDKSILGDAADKVIEEKNKKDSTESKSNSQEDNKKEVTTNSKDDSKKETPNEEDEISELINLNVDDIKTGAGKPISKASGEVISRFKNNLTKLNKELQELKSKAADQSPQLTEEFEKIKTERDELKKQIDTELFEKSDGFKQAFIQPVIDSHSKISKYFIKLDKVEDADEITSVRNLLEKAVSRAEAGDEDGFADILDTIVDDHIGGGSSKKALFSADMMNMFKVTQDKVKAFTDKEANRKKIVETKLEQARRTNTVSIDRDIDSHIEKFEFKKKAILNGLQGKEKEDYVSKYKNNVGKFKEAITDFAITGKISDGFAHIIQQGITAEAIEHENALLFTGYQDSMNLVKQKNDEISELKSKLSKLSGEPSDSKRKGGHVKSDVGTEEKSPYKSAIFAALQKIQSS